VSAANIYAMVNGLKSFITANLPTYLRAVEAEIGITIADPAEHVLGYRETFASAHYPCAFYVFADATPDASSQQGQWITATVDVVIAYKHSKPETLEKAIIGISDAMVNLIGENEGLGGICDVAEITYLDAYHGAPLSKDIAAVLVTVAMRTEART
jgi:hypothetical protein